MTASARPTPQVRKFPIQEGNNEFYYWRFFCENGLKGCCQSIFFAPYQTITNLSRIICSKTLVISATVLICFHICWRSLQAQPVYSTPGQKITRLLCIEADIEGNQWDISSGFEDNKCNLLSSIREQISPCFTAVTSAGNI